MSSADPTAPAGALCSCLAELCRIVCSAGQGIWRGRHPAVAPLALFLIARLYRLARRLRSLAARHAAGTLTAPKAPVRKQADPNAERIARRPDPLPRGDAWLLRLLMRPETEDARCALVGQVNMILTAIAGAEMQRLIADAPRQAGRLLRPLIRMTLGEAEIPECLRLPPKPKRPRPQRPRGNPSPNPLPQGEKASAPAPSPLAGLGREADQGRGEGAAPSSPPKPPPPAPESGKLCWRVVPVIRVVWRKPNVVRIRAGPRFLRG